MTKKDYILIANVLKHFKEYFDEKTITNLLKDKSINAVNAILGFLIDEFSYKLEDDNRLFNEKKI